MAEIKLGGVLTITKLKKMFDGYASRVLTMTGFLNQLERKKGAIRKYEIIQKLPTQVEYKTLRNKHFSYSVTDLVSGAISVFGELKDEMEEWRDNLDGTGLENTNKYSMVEAAAEQLEYCTEEISEFDAVMEKINSAFGEGGDLKAVVLPTLRNRRCPDSRPNRLSDAVTEMEAAKEAIDDFKNALDEEKEQEFIQEIEYVIGELDEMISNAECVEFPGMFD